MLYHLDGQRIDEIKISPGIMLLVLSRDDSTAHVPLRLLCIESGEVLVELEQPVARRHSQSGPLRTRNLRPK